MENITATEILELLDNTEKIISVSAYGTKLIAHKTITGRLDIENKRVKETVTFLNCAFEDLIIENTHCDDSIEFRQCTFLKDFRIIFLHALNFNLENCQFEKALIIQNCRLRYLIFDRVEAQNGIMLEGGQIILLDIKPISEKTSFSFTGMFLLIHTLSVISQSGITIFAKNSIINIINLTGYLNLSSRLDFNHIKNKKIAIYELNNSGKIYFSNLKPVGVAGFKDNTLAPYIEAYRNSASAAERELQFLSMMGLKISTLELLTGNYPLFGFRDYMEKNHFTEFLVYFDTLEVKFHIHNSSAGIMELKAIMFDKYQIEIINSDLSAVKLLHSKIPDIKAQDDYLNYYNVYNDLYSAAVRQNNSKDKAYYYKIGQQYLNKYLRHARYVNDGDLGSLIAITASRIYSSHGTDWIRACLMTMLTAFIFFGFFTGSLENINLDMSKSGAAYFFEDILPFFPQFVNPLHRIDIMSDVSPLGGWSALFDFISRIFVSIGIFEIVRSFRKHVRQ
ncbi:hypothetical protein [Flavobacterium pectinovorum]|uniref:Pentapeptide repeat-containing protein n=1 Tax=Flavobacterium pectinovorum TaxID=29533 RepID=A0AB36P5W1_9FLAO|nr:hypothetical protein [Flavobacterium pectinovorum]OXB07739.1 hypothetical protein B0A72_02410 [Flavobacterium pectinovorum]SHM78755.1 hypothetical protein SAMN05444387_3189 [Flavobacterium pectinovorum]